VGYPESTSCLIDDTPSHVCIRQDSLDTAFGRSARLPPGSHDWQYSKIYPPETYTAHLESFSTDPMSPDRCQKHLQSMAFRSWNSAVSTEAASHCWHRLEMGLYRWIPVTMLPTIGCLGRGLSGTSHGCSSLIWLIPDV
jgi:hypothetical protein